MTAMERLISEITMRATSKVLGPGVHPQRVAAIAEPLVDGIMDLVVSQDSQSEPPAVTFKDYVAWEIWNRIIDEIEKEIPVVSEINVVLNGQASRKDRALLVSDEWRKTVSKPIHNQE